MPLKRLFSLYNLYKLEPKTLNVSCGRPSRKVEHTSQAPVQWCKVELGG